MAEGWGGFLGVWEEFHAEAVDEYLLDAERVLVLTVFSARGKTSGLELGRMRTRGASLFRFRGGKVMRLVLCFDGERALADVGLARRAGSPHSQRVPHRLSLVPLEAIAKLPLRRYRQSNPRQLLSTTGEVCG